MRTAVRTVVRRSGPKVHNMNDDCRSIHHIVCLLLFLPLSVKVTLISSSLTYLREQTNVGV